MTISGIGISTSDANSVQLPKAANSATSKPTSLATDTVTFTANGEADSTRASNANLLFFGLNESILDQGTLSGVQSVIASYKQSLPDSNVYISSYTAPSAQFLKDLTTLSNAAGAGNLANATSALAQAKLDGPGNVLDGLALPWPRVTSEAKPAFSWRAAAICRTSWFNRAIPFQTPMRRRAL